MSCPIRSAWAEVSCATTTMSFYLAVFDTIRRGLVLATITIFGGSGVAACAFLTIIAPLPFMTTHNAPKGRESWTPGVGQGL